MRTLINISDQTAEALAMLCKQDKSSRNELIRAAIDAYLKKRRHELLMSGFGIWKDRGIDGLEHQRKLREEWPE